MKLLVLLPLTLPVISVALIRFGHSFLNYLSPKIHVIFVMAAFPLVMNVIQFCLVDQVIKSSREGDKDDIDVEAGYRRIPAREADVATTPRALTVGHARRRGSALNSRSASPITPNSPLLSPADVRDSKWGIGVRHEYDSTTPSPILREGPTAAFWASLTKRSLEGEQEGSSVFGRSFDSTLNGDHSLVVRHGQRSGAPSPDSLRAESMESRKVKAPEDVSIPASDPPSSVYATIRLSDDMRVEARKSLSPVVKQGLTVSREEWGLTERSSPS